MACSSVTKGARNLPVLGFTIVSDLFNISHLLLLICRVRVSNEGKNSTGPAYKQDLKGEFYSVESCGRGTDARNG
jgi:hypothetical protein